MQYTKLIKSGYKKGLSSVLLLVAMPGVNNVGFHPAWSAASDAEHTQGAIQLANAREFMDDDTIRLSASSPRQISQVNRFVSEFAESSLKGSWKKKSLPVARAIIDSSLRHGFDPLLILAVIENESRFDPTVLGSHGEIGLMQLKPDTAEWVAKKSGIRWTGAAALKNPVTNIRIGAAYLSMLRAKFGFKKDLYLAAYNMGSRNVSRLMNDNVRPQVYPQKTMEHYSRIYLKFMGPARKAKDFKKGALAAI